LRYDPEQPRHPAGTPEGGRWSGGIGSDFVVAPDRDEQDRREWLAKLHEPPRPEVVRNSGVLLDPNGDPVLNMYGEQILFPLGFQTDKVMEAADSVRFSLENGNTIEVGFAELVIDLGKFRQGGEWDVQRYPGSFTWEYRDYSTVLIGLYGERAGMPADMMLFIENVFARVKSTFSRFEPMNPTYTALPERNVFNTMLGYRLGANGR
jgi:hypothetical protein